MVEVTEDKIKFAGANIFLWRKVYNNLCRSCQRKVFNAGTGVKDKGTQEVTNQIDYVIKNNMCKICSDRIKLMLR